MRIRELRKKRRYTQGQLANLLGVRQCTVSNWEAGRRIPSWHTILRIGLLFDVPVEKLQFGIGQAQERVRIG